MLVFGSWRANIVIIIVRCHSFQLSDEAKLIDTFDWAFNDFRVSKPDEFRTFSEPPGSHRLSDPTSESFPCASDHFEPYRVNSSRIPRTRSPSTTSRKRDEHCSPALGARTRNKTLSCQAGLHPLDGVTIDAHQRPIYRCDGQ